MASDKIRVDITADNSKLKSAVNDSEKHLDGFGQSVKKIGGLLAGAFAVDRIIDFGKEAINLSAQAEGVRAAFARLSTPGLLRDLRKATSDTVSDLNLMKRAVQAANFDIPLTQMASLLEFASKRAQETGQSVDYLVDSIVLGIGRKSPLILDNLGISAVRLRQELNGAGTELASVGDIAAAVGKIAQEEMEKAGGVIKTTAVELQQLVADFENAKVKIGSSLIGIYSYLRKGYTDLKDWKEFFDLRAEVDFLQKMGLSVDNIVRMNPDVREFGGIWKEVADGLDEAALRATTFKGQLDSLDLKKLNELFSPRGEGQKAILSSIIESMGPLADINIQITRAQESLTAARAEDIPIILQRIEALEEERRILMASGMTMQLYRNNLKQTHSDMVNDATSIVESSKKVGSATEDFGESVNQMLDVISDSIDDTFEDVKRVVTPMENLLEDMAKQIGESMVMAFGSWAQSAGAAIKANEGLGASFQQLGSAIAGALGQILILAGLKAIEAGAVLEGLALMGIGLVALGVSGFIGGSPADISNGGGGGITSTNLLWNTPQQNEFIIRGSTLVSANSQASGLTNRLG